jgi:hypothetical protein
MQTPPVQMKNEHNYSEMTDIIDVLNETLCNAANRACIDIDETNVIIQISGDQLTCEN